MSKEEQRPDSRIKNIEPEEDASATKDAPRIVEVRKRDNAADKDNKFVLHQKPFDEQMNESYDDRRSNYSDEEAD
ncbi:MAG: hypothetical protein ACO1NS_06035 [Daejeonella sp.]|uniref:hypothetical protein n=1 Tax=Daejeonella sp. JGW-45 TaxID=3034148 RepID=UPI0023ED5460|nr:hypothetical protein [Daejeonella sp. JGW-45]